MLSAVPGWREVRWPGLDSHSIGNTYVTLRQMVDLHFSGGEWESFAMYLEIGLPVCVDYEANGSLA